MSGRVLHMYLLLVSDTLQQLPSFQHDVRGMSFKQTAALLVTGKPMGDAEVQLQTWEFCHLIRPVPIHHRCMIPAPLLSPNHHVLCSSGSLFC